MERPQKSCTTEAADAASAALAQSLRADARQLRAAMTRQTQDLVFDISRRVLGELASASLEQQACAVFIQRLQTIDGAARATLGAALAAASAAEPALLRSAFELPAAQRAAIQTAVEECFGQTPPLRFETAPALVSGIGLRANGQKLAWSIADYLSSLQRGVGELLKAQAVAGHPPPAAPGKAGP